MSILGLPGCVGYRPPVSRDIATASVGARPSSREQRLTASGSTGSWPLVTSAARMEETAMPSARPSLDLSRYHLAIGKNGAAARAYRGLKS